MTRSVGARGTFGAARPVRTAALFVSLLLVPAQRADAQGAGCPPGTDELVAAAWRAYRADSMSVAAARFDSALAACPRNADAAVGRAYTHLRGGAVDAADAMFKAVLAKDSASADAWEGSATVAQRRGDTAGAIAAWRRVIALVPASAEARTQLDRLAPDWERPVTARPRVRAAAVDLTLRVKGEGFELLRNGRWEPFFMKGVNLGLALPGKFPAEFPTDSALYARWFAQIGEMHANTLRVYTVLPPTFYRALRAHNLAHPQAPLYLVHGVWTELPPRDDFNDAGFNAEFAKEIRDVVDLLHGTATISTRPGHAGGRYDADVSPWTIGYILGREWEPYSVVGFNDDPRAARSHAGKHLILAKGTATDAWMVRQCDLLVTYEDEIYNAQRPIAYTNWPTTDPIVHPTETSYADEMRLRGLRYDVDPNAAPVHEEEGVSLDPSLVRTTARNAAGWFASYHVYPYYPDFLIQDPGYSRASSSQGRSNYFGYLQDLRRVHRGIPLVISEFGVPTSRGNAHAQPQGWDHGGLNENEAAAIDARLAAEIREVGAAGAIVFAWMDEWFKRNWFVDPFEKPNERGRLWHNIMSPEEHYGLLALRPGAPGRSPELGGDAARWLALRTVQQGRLLGADTVTLRVGQDEGFVYLALSAASWRGRAFPWDSTRLQLGIDTFDPERGQVLLPESGVRSRAAFEFLLALNGPRDAQLKVVPDYLPYTPERLTQNGAMYGEPFRRPLLTVRRFDAVFDSLFALTNRPRYLRDGRRVRGIGHNPGRLVFGTLAEDSNADWWYDQRAGVLQIRLPWALLNVGDPSSRRVLTESDPEQALGRRPEAPASVITSVPTDGFRFGVVALRPGPDVLGTMPALDPYGNWPLASFNTWTWPTWEAATWHEYLKPGYYALQRLWSSP